MKLTIISYFSILIVLQFKLSTTSTTLLTITSPEFDDQILQSVTTTDRLTNVSLVLSDTNKINPLPKNIIPEDATVENIIKPSRIIQLDAQDDDIISRGFLDVNKFSTILKERNLYERPVVMPIYKKIGKILKIMFARMEMEKEHVDKSAKKTSWSNAENKDSKVLFKRYLANLKKPDQSVTDTPVEEPTTKLSMRHKETPRQKFDKWAPKPDYDYDNIPTPGPQKKVVVLSLDRKLSPDFIQELAIFIKDALLWNNPIIKKLMRLRNRLKSAVQLQANVHLESLHQLASEFVNGLNLKPWIRPMRHRMTQLLDKYDVNQNVVNSISDLMT